jgi:hypothetical protein
MPHFCTLYWQFYVISDQHPWLKHSTFRLWKLVHCFSFGYCCLSESRFYYLKSFCSSSSKFEVEVEHMHCSLWSLHFSEGAKIQRYDIQRQFTRCSFKIKYAETFKSTACDSSDSAPPLPNEWIVYKCHLAASSQTSSHLVRLGSLRGLVDGWIGLSGAGYIEVFLWRLITAKDVSCVSEDATSLDRSQYLSWHCTCQSA